MFGNIGKDLNEEFAKRFKMEKEVVKFQKNGMETTVTIYFYESGVVASTSAVSRLIKSEKEEKREQLIKQIEEAVKKEDYDLASKLKKEKDSL